MEVVMLGGSDAGLEDGESAEKEGKEEEETKEKEKKKEEDT